MPKNIFVKLFQRPPALHPLVASAEQIVNVITSAMSLPNNPQVKLSSGRRLLSLLAFFRLHVPLLSETERSFYLQY